MKRVCSLMFFALLTVTVFGQTKAPKIKKNKTYTSASGLQYTIYDIHKKAPKADSGDVVSVHYLGRLEDGTEFDASYNRQQPISFTLGTGRVIKAWDEGIQYLRVGDSALFVIPPEIGYGARAMGSIPANSTLYFTVKLVNVKKPVKPYDVAKLDTIKLDAGLSYIVVKKGKGKVIEEGDKAHMQYTGYFTDGRKFDSSHDNGSSSFSFILGRGRVIQGWEKGILGMKVGEKRRLNVPYHLAYGEKGRMPIPPKSDLVFDVLLEKIEKINYPDFDLKGKDTVELDDGLKYILVDSTSEAKIEAHDIVTIQYVGQFTDGKVFDSSYDRGDSLVFEVGARRVIKGLDNALLNLRKGERVRVLIPYKLAYGERGREPVIPAKSDLIFDIYIQNVKKED